ncbi:MAG: hypothetical protein KJS45_01370 [Bacteroidetes bacterium]|nr:hypothetical protein [Bacteroidota bacterium]
MKKYIDKPDNYEYQKHFSGLFAQGNQPPHNKNNFVNCYSFNELKLRLGSGQLRQIIFILYIWRKVTVYIRELQATLKTKQQQ